jgi:hypothetical protein
MSVALPVQEPGDPADWTIEDTILNISQMDPTLAMHVEAFRSHEIDGRWRGNHLSINQSISWANFIIPVLSFLSFFLYIFHEWYISFGILHTVHYRT